MRDPITNEIGKGIVFCVSRKHATKITQLLNVYADKMFPDKYYSDFATTPIKLQAKKPLRILMLVVLMLALPF